MADHRGVAGPTRAPQPEHVVEAARVVGTEEETSYHQDLSSQYLLPNNSPEHTRLEEQAALLSALQNHRVLHAPVRDGADVRTLDIGCGTGIVTHLMGRTFPSAQCFGLDISLVPNIRPQTANVHFLQGSVTAQSPSEWRSMNDTTTTTTSPFPDNTALFDYVFSRLLILGMSNWPAYIRTQFSLLKPGGWAEIHEPDWEYFDSSGHSIPAHWLASLAQLCEEKGMDLHCGRRVEQWMREAGFADVQVVRYSWSYGTTSEPDPAVREFGFWMVKHYPAMLAKLLQHAMRGRVAPGEIAEMEREMREMLGPEAGKKLWFYVTVGRKPE